MITHWTVHFPVCRELEMAQFSRAVFCSFIVPPCRFVILKLGNPCNLFEMCWDMESLVSPCNQGLTSCVLGSACNCLLLPTFSSMFPGRSLACFRDQLGSVSGINRWSPSGKKLKMLKYEFWSPGC